MKKLIGAGILAVLAGCICYAVDQKKKAITSENLVKEVTDLMDEVEDTLNKNKGDE